MLDLSSGPLCLQGTHLRQGLVQEVRIKVELARELGDFLQRECLAALLLQLLR
ncbi:MAG: hypothetical protein ACO1SX_01565 [Actinomycetota bacterium]|jgi:hypothetical protein